MTDSSAQTAIDRFSRGDFVWKKLMIATCLWLLAALPVQAGQVTVFAAASLKTALDDIAEVWRDKTGHDVILSFGGSSALARQVQHGAPADIFVSANVAWMDVLEREGLIKSNSRFDLAGNRLVLIAHGEQVAPSELRPGFDLGAVLGEGRLAMALVEAVPAGMYGMQALLALEMWEEAAPRIAQVDNVRAALALVARGEAPAGIVYATDAKLENRVSVIGEFPKGSHDPIRYPAAIVTHSRSEIASDFMAFLSSEDAQQVLQDHGFVRLGLGNTDSSDHASMSQ